MEAPVETVKKRPGSRSPRLTAKGLMKKKTRVVLMNVPVKKGLLPFAEVSPNEHFARILRT